MRPKFDFWATVCKTVRPKLSDRCSVCLSVCLSVTLVSLVYCSQTVGWIKIKLDVQVGLSPGHITLDGDSASPPLKGRSPLYSANVRCGQTAAWTKMPFGMEVDLGPARQLCLRWGPRSPRKMAQPPTQFLAHVYIVAKLLDGRKRHLVRK